MKRLFVDTGYWIALLSDKDALHPQAQKLSKMYEDAQLVTTEMVLVELLNHLGGESRNVRLASATFVEMLRSNSNVVIVRQTSTQFSKALTLYTQRSDKRWSLTDCASFLVMKKAGLTEALAHDVHFEQAGFVALLRRK